MVGMKVSHDDSFHVFDVVASGFDGIGKLHVFGVDSAWEDISE